MTSETPDALRRDLEEHHAASFGWALSCCGRDRTEAEDVLQIAYLRVLSGEARFEGRSSLKTWLFGVIRQVAREQRRKRLLRWLGIGRASAEPTTTKPALPASPEQSAEQAEDARAVIAGLSTLSDRQREVLHLVFYADLTVREAAAVMNVSAGTAALHYERGKKALASHLAKRGIVR
ncbi:MAG: sigma-70 family RNA polymerase sigma factor [Deltaproteobacteria bacterium]|nr:sigma-70 family RNA polymerase sigma factor [Deltaproteobacteria bacterium]